ncbi:MAG: GNAT family N-acetyltransferase [Arcobacter sp.]|uniref:GNAT family N-acetyltransferase n=1 Tax=Arcobacter sp. TaxID=1872629 RepID=UPI003AFFB94B
MILRSDLQICKATSVDIPILVTLLEALFSIEKDFIFDKKKHEVGLKLLLQNKKAIVVIAKFKDEIVAMVTMQTIISTAIGAKTGLIEDFVVTNDFQDMGIGTYLFEYLKKYAKDNNLKRIQLVCDNDNTNAKEFYTKKAFTKSNLSAWYNHI